MSRLWMVCGTDIWALKPGTVPKETRKWGPLTDPCFNMVRLRISSSGTRASGAHHAGDGGHLKTLAEVPVTVATPVIPADLVTARDVATINSL